ncbi:hypothetical protein ACPCG0_09415 [Propionibacteriaceae bacterium Y1923]
MSTPADEPRDTDPPADPQDAGSWRRRDAELRDQLSRSSALNESARAQVLVDDFVAQAVAKGILTERLVARLMDGREVRTDKRGWYIRANRSVAVGEDGSYYVLTVPGGWRERLRGVRLEASPPPLVVGRGARDGDSGDLSTFLAWRLAQG